MPSCVGYTGAAAGGRTVDKDRDSALCCGHVGGEEGGGVGVEGLGLVAEERGGGQMMTLSGDGVLVLAGRSDDRGLFADR